MKTITIAAPIRNRENYLDSYLECLRNLEYDKKAIGFHFVVNNSKDSSIDILLNFKKEFSDEYSFINIEEMNSPTVLQDDKRDMAVRITQTYSHLAQLRNHILHSCTTDYLLSVDSDIMVSKSTLSSLIASDKNICSALICNGYLYDSISPYKYTNILKKLPYTDKNGELIYKHVSGTGEDLIEVDFAGAVILISTKICKNNKISYGWSKWGEDQPFCLSAQKEGEKLYCDKSIKLTHCMNEYYLNKYIKNEFVW